ncbi:MAG: sigma-70 family RNA polymerase sigma factor [Acholeplasmatales bacterium]|nr:MAG: sigma-70 family RNA polymerase sigma factor [Acholeplasmatales bacterium]
MTILNRYPRHNDYEIIGLIQEGDADAVTLLAKKYGRMIAKKIHKFNLAYVFDDMYQEGLMVLYKSAITFNPTFNKTFTRYFEMNYERYLITTVTHFRMRSEVEFLHKQDIHQSVHSVRESSVYFPLHLKELKNVLTDTEYRVYILREVKNVTVDAIATELAIPIKSVYNALHRAKAKIRRYFQA